MESTSPERHSVTPVSDCKHFCLLFSTIGLHPTSPYIERAKLGVKLRAGQTHQKNLKL